MKTILRAAILSCFLLAAAAGTAQTSTYIFIRHAEKDTARTDPGLSLKGVRRAEQLVSVLQKYRPDEIYSTDYARTRATVQPLARKFGKAITIYDPHNLPAFAESLLKQKGKTIIVCGHSNTTPALVNLILKDKRYPDMNDSVYNQFWIVTVSEGKITAKEVVY